MSKIMIYKQQSKENVRWKVRPLYSLPRSPSRDSTAPAFAPNVSPAKNGGIVKNPTDLRFIKLTMASTILAFLLKPLMLLALCSSVSVHFSSRAVALAIGVNWGRMASHPLPPPQVVQLLKANIVSKVRLFDADPVVLQSLAGSNIGVTVGIPNTMLRSLNSSLKAAENWVHDNLTRYVSPGAASAVRIEYLFLS